jgi:hypothetical protein
MIVRHGALLATLSIISPAEPIAQQESASKVHEI